MNGRPGGQQAEFDRLVRPHVRPLYQTAYRLTGMRADAEDLVQDVLVKLYPRTRELARITELRPWLLRVLYNQFVDLQRRRARTPQSSEGDELVAMIHAADACPEDDMARAETSTQVEAALARLDDGQRALVVMHVMAGHTLKSLTEVFDAPIGTLKSRLHRAKAKLKTLLSVEPFSSDERVGRHELSRSTSTHRDAAGAGR